MDTTANFLLTAAVHVPSGDLVNYTCDKLPLGKKTQSLTFSQQSGGPNALNNDAQ